MLVIRTAQLEKMEEGFRAELRRRSSKMLLADGAFQKNSTDAAKLENLLQVADQRIDTYGGNPTRDLVRYVKLMMRLGEDFSSVSPWKELVFDEAEIPGAAKLDAVEVYLKNSGAPV